MPTYQTVIHWFRRDLRLTDNTALHHAAKNAANVVPVYIVSSWSKNHRWTGAPRQDFLCECLRSLQQDIVDAGGRLIFRKGTAREELETLISETKADALYLNRDPDPFGRDMENQVIELCRSLGVAVHSHKDCVLHEPDEVLTGDASPYKVYTPYAKKWFTVAKASPLPRVEKIVTPSSIKSDPTPDLDTWDLPEHSAQIIEAGEQAARSRLDTALDGSLLRYKEKRNDPTGITTSMIGPDLRFGTLSVREVFHHAQDKAESVTNASQRESIQTFQKQLAWREFFMAILGHYPEVLETEFNPKWRGLSWDDPGEDDKFEKWIKGMTGFPIVDAGMRQLLATGYMHNRVRMIVAMFLTKDLHIDWRLGESHFMQCLVDGEIANNNGGWQWSAGTGADAAPYFRMQNPWTQTSRYDPDGIYIKKWIPELKEVEAKRFQKPPEPLDPLADDYPLPIVDHKEERERTLAIFKKHGETK